MSTIDIQYRFKISERKEHVFDIRLDPVTLELVNTDRDTPKAPSWAALDYHKCGHCPLSSSTHSTCPLAVSLAGIVARFEGIISYDELSLDVVTEERVISQRTTAQRGISSLMGLVIAASGCPHTAHFRPMARFHLPLASEEETLYRVTSMYLLGQYFRMQAGLGGELDFAGLAEIYQNIEKVNVAITTRLRAATKTDSSVNAIICLDIYAKIIPYFLEDKLDKTRTLFSSFFCSDAPVE